MHKYYYFKFRNNIVQAARIIGTELATTGLIGAGVGIRVDFRALILGVYLLSTIYRNSESATLGGLIYFLLGGLLFCFILLSTSLLYANLGTTNLDNLYIINSILKNSLDTILDIKDSTGNILL
ncbi:hypothetical protein BU16DRAFT_473222 [Lophium mytilinum]|uniref:NADH:quinone oxidoreductase/Mrp antiporter transmembrane domain-containing protein n=1 Tax=Lophium mytilinum TaxID=390894 RepID=A0A6A6Q9U0_9PEZI|nr:hypothetical protein BU16DRAFT_473222 [Lophium mytilinum]